MFFRPTTKPLQRLDQRASQFCERVFYFRWHHGMDSALNQAIALKAAQSLGQHLLRNPADLPLQSSVTHGAACKNLNDERRPFVSNAIEHQPRRAPWIEN